MERFREVVTKICLFFDKIAAWGTAILMVLVVGNIILRISIKRPILGTYEYVGYLAALVIGLALAYCAIQNSHIEVRFLLERFPPKVQVVIDIVVGFISLIFLILSTWHTGKYAYSMILSGEVSPTTRTPFYPFVFLVAFSLLALSLVVLLKLIENIRKGVRA